MQVFMYPFNYFFMVIWCMLLLETHSCFFPKSPRKRSHKLWFHWYGQIVTEDLKCLWLDTDMNPWPKVHQAPPVGLSLSTSKQDLQNLVAEVPLYIFFLNNAVALSQSLFCRFTVWYRYCWPGCPTQLTLHSVPTVAQGSTGMPVHIHVLA